MQDTSLFVFCKIINNSHRIDKRHSPHNAYLPHWSKEKSAPYGVLTVIQKCSSASKDTTVQFPQIGLYSLSPMLRIGKKFIIIIFYFIIVYIKKFVKN